MIDEKQLGDGPVNRFHEALKIQADALKAKVDSGDLPGAMSIISELNETRDRTLYQEVGQLTRSLHESIRNFHIDTAGAGNHEEISKINDASDRLDYVVDMTSKAANKTLDLVEDTMPFASEIRTEAKLFSDEWNRLRRKEMKPEEFRQLSAKLGDFLDKLSVDADKVCKNLSDILLAQDFQDLTGQVINRVTSLVKDVEDSLVNLVRMAGKVDQIAGLVHEKGTEQSVNKDVGEGPQVHADVRDDVVSGQDDVDDLLSSLGF